VAGQVEHQHAVALDELRHQLDPVRRGPAQPVHEHDRVAAAAHEVAQPDIAPLEEALVEQVRCSRHPGTVSSDDHGELWDAGPLIPAETTRAVIQPA
jgi:hypothetical protein